MKSISKVFTISMIAMLLASCDSSYLSNKDFSFQGIDFEMSKSELVSKGYNCVSVNETAITECKFKNDDAYSKVTVLQNGVIQLIETSKAYVGNQKQCFSSLYDIEELLKKEFRAYIDYPLYSQGRYSSRLENGESYADISERLNTEPLKVVDEENRAPTIRRIRYSAICKVQSDNKYTINFTFENKSAAKMDFSKDLDKMFK